MSENDRKKVTAWITKYLFARGILEFKGHVKTILNVPAFVADCKGALNNQALFQGKEWHLNKEDAVYHAKKMIERKRKAIQKQLDKLDKIENELGGMAKVRTGKGAPKQPKRCQLRSCKAVWTCRDCQRKCCEHHCSHKTPDHFASCGECASVTYASRKPSKTAEEEALEFLYEDEKKLEKE